MGEAAEELVARELVRRHYRIVGRNVAVGNLGELDIVARNDKEVVIVEVRSRNGDEDPCESIGPAKRRRIRRTAAAYLLDRPIDYEEVRIFVGVVHFKEGDADIKVIEDAF